MSLLRKFRRLNERKEARLAKKQPRKAIIEALEPRVLLSADLGVIDDGGLNEYFDSVQTQLDSAVFSAPIPLIGTQLAENQSGRIAEKISDSLESFTIVPVSGTEATADDVKSGLLAALRYDKEADGDFLDEGDFDLIEDTDKDGDFLDEIGVEWNADYTVYTFFLTLGGSESERIDLDLALGEDAVIGAKLGVEDEVFLQFDWTFDLSFGVIQDSSTLESLFFVDTGAGNELKLDEVWAFIDGGDDFQLAAKGTAGVFSALIREDAGHPALPATPTEPAEDAIPKRDSEFTGRFDIDIRDDNFDADTRLISRLALDGITYELDLSELELSAIVNGQGDINLDINAAMDPDFLFGEESGGNVNFAVDTDVRITQSFEAANTQRGQFGSKINIDYESVRLDVGSFFSGTFDPTIKYFQDKYSDIKEYVDYLIYPIPGLSKLGEELGYGAITPIDIAILYNVLFATPDPKLPPAEQDKQKLAIDKRLFALNYTKETISKLNGLYELGPIGGAIPEKVPESVNLGDQKIQLTPQGEFEDKPEDDDGDIISVKPELIRQKAIAVESKIFGASEEVKSTYATFNGNLQFPFLNDPEAVLSMLRGETSAELVNFGAAFDIGSSVAWQWPIIAIPGLEAEFKIDLSAALDIDFGYDLFGVNLLTNTHLDFSSEDALTESREDFDDLLYDGFYFDDHLSKNADGQINATDGQVYDPGIPFLRKPTGDKPELVFALKLTGTGKYQANLGLANAAAGVSLFGKFAGNFDLNDLPEPQSPEQIDYINQLDDGKKPEVPEAPFTYDGRVRYNEQSLIVKSNPLGLFNASGEVSIGLEAYIKASVDMGFREVVILDKTVPIFKVNVWDGNIYQLDDADVLAGERILAAAIGKLNPINSLPNNPGNFEASAAPDLVFAATDEGSDPTLLEPLPGELTLFMGAENVRLLRENTDAKRGLGSDGNGGDPENENEGFGISSLGLTVPGDPEGGETLLVKYLVQNEDLEWVERAQETFPGVMSIFADGGSGDDYIVVGENVMADVTFYGGTGNDVLFYAGQGEAKLYGDADDDTLTGGSADDILEGGTGNDNLIGGGGDDTLRGGAGEDGVDGGLGDDDLSGGTGSDTYYWSPGQGVDTIREDADLPDDNDQLFVGGSFELTQGSWEAGSVGIIEAGDTVSLNKIDDGGVLKVLLETSDGIVPVESLLLDNIEAISINAGGGSDEVTVSDLAGTDVNLLTIDLGASDEPDAGSDADFVFFKGDDGPDELTVTGVTTFGTDSAGDPLGQIVQLRDELRNSEAYIINSAPDMDTLVVQGMAGDDTLEVSAGVDNIDVSDLIAVKLDGGEGSDTLISMFDNVMIDGGLDADGDDTDTVLIKSDGKAVDGVATLELFATDLLVSRNETGFGLVEDRVSFSEVEAFRLELWPATAGSDLHVVSTIAGDVEIFGSSFDDTIRLETLAGATTLDLNGGENIVTIGKNGSVAGIAGDLEIRGGSGSDHVIFDSSAEVSGYEAAIGVVALTGLVAPGTLRYVNKDDDENKAVETVELRLGSGADRVKIPDLTRRVIVDLGGGEDSVDATLEGTPVGLASGAGLITYNTELVDFTNTNNAGPTDWLVTENELRAGAPGLFDQPFDSGYEYQSVLQTDGANLVTITLGEGDNGLRIWDLATETHVTLGGGNDAVTIGDSSSGAGRTLNDIKARLVLNGQSADNDTLTIDDAANGSDASIAIGPGSITGFGTGQDGHIDYSGFTSLSVELGARQDTVTVTDTSITTTILTDPDETGVGDDVTVLNASAGATIELRGGDDLITVKGGDGLTIDGGDALASDTIIFDISALTSPTSGSELSENSGVGQLNKLGPIGKVDFDGVEFAQVRLGQNSDAFTLDIAVPDLLVGVVANGGDDTITVKRIPGRTDRTGNAGPTTAISGGTKGIDTVVVEIPGAPWAGEHDNLITDLSVVEVEALWVNNADYTGSVDWRIDDGRLLAVDPAGIEADLPLVFADAADEVQVLAGTGSGDALTVTATSNPVEATIDGDQLELIAGELVLERAGSVDDLPSRKNVIDFDDELLLGPAETVEDVNVSFNITHTYDWDVQLELVSPNGTVVALLSSVGIDGDNFTLTTLDDEATTSIASGAAPFSGSFRPLNPLSAFDGETVDGDWLLRVADNYPAADDGVLLDWSLQLTTNRRTLNLSKTVGQVFPTAGGGLLESSISVSTLPTYEEDGFVIAGNGALALDGSISPALAAGSGTSGYTVTRANGNAFAIDSLDLAAPTAGTKTVTLRGTTVNGSTVTQTLSFEGAHSFVTRTVDLGSKPGFAALLALDIELGAGTGILVDNIVAQETLAFAGAATVTAGSVPQTLFVDNPLTPNVDESRPVEIRFFTASNLIGVDYSNNGTYDFDEYYYTDSTFHGVALQISDIGNNTTQFSFQGDLVIPTGTLVQVWDNRLASIWAANDIITGSGVRFSASALVVSASSSSPLGGGGAGGIDGNSGPRATGSYSPQDGYNGGPQGGNANTHTGAGGAGGTGSGSTGGAGGSLPGNGGGGGGGGMGGAGGGWPYGTGGDGGGGGRGGAGGTGYSGGYGGTGDVGTAGLNSSSSSAGASGSRGTYGGTGAGGAGGDVNIGGGGPGGGGGGGSKGGDGGNGSGGGRGTNSVSAAIISGGVISGGGGGGAGGGGGGGGRGGGGGGGSGGGAYGGSAGGLYSSGSNGAIGAGGGAGGSGGYGGGGGVGGSGGAGGGALELVAQGKVSLGSNNILQAKGAPGVNGSSGAGGSAGTAGQNGGGTPSTGALGGSGGSVGPGNGGDGSVGTANRTGGGGGAGGKGGTGGAGGGGGGGAGGTLKVEGSVVSLQHASFYRSGGLGGFTAGTSTRAETGGSGRLILGSNTTTSFNNYGAEILNAPSREDNRFNGYVSTPRIAGLPGGAAAFGLLGSNVTAVSLGLGAVDPDALFAVLRLNADDARVPSEVRAAYDGFDFVFYVNLLDVPLLNPQIGFNGTPALALQDDGVFGTRTIGALAAHQVWVTLVPDTAPVSVVAKAFGIGEAAPLAVAQALFVQAEVPVFPPSLEIGGLQGIAVANQPILDFQTTQSILNVPDNFTITDLNVGLQISHTNDSNLSVFLVSPSGTEVQLFAGVGGAGDNFTGTVLDDEAVTPITSASAPFTGSFRPQGSLAAFDGESEAGNWTLRITDGFGQDDGTLERWSLTVTGTDGSENTFVKSASQIYAVNPNQDALVVLNAADFSLRQHFTDGFDGITSLGGASDVAVSADGKNVYVVSKGDRQVTVFSRDAGGNLTFQQALGGFTFDVYETIAVRPGSGDRVVVGGAGGVGFFNRDPETGFLTQAKPFGGLNTVDVAFSIDGDVVYTVFSAGVLALNPDNQALVDFALMSDASAVAVAEIPGTAGYDVYVTTSTGSLHVFKQAARTAELVPDDDLTLRENERGIRGLAGASDILVSADGTLVYVTSKSSNTLTAFSRDLETGRLRFAQILRGGPGLFAPSAIAGAGDGRVYVASETGFGSANGGLGAFAPFGALQSSFTVGFDGIEELTVNTGTHDDVIRQINAATVSRLTIDAGDGFNTVDLLNIATQTQVLTGGGGDTITVRSDLAGSPAPGDFTLKIETGAGEDSVVVRELAVGNIAGIDLGDDDDLIQIAGEKLPAALPENIVIDLDGGDGNDELRFSTGNAAVDPQQPYLNEDGTIKAADPAFGTVKYQSVEDIPGFEPSVADVAKDADDNTYMIEEGEGLSLLGEVRAATNTTIDSVRWDLNGDGVFGDAVSVLSGPLNGTVEVSAVLSWEELVALGIGDGDADYEITLEVIDSEDNVASDTGLLTIINTEPDVTASGAASALVGVPYTLIFGLEDFSDEIPGDPGDDTINAWAVDWGDRAPGAPLEFFASDATSASHVYQKPSVFTPIVYAADEDVTDPGDPATWYSAVSDTMVTVAPPTPIIETIGTAANLEINEGDGVTFRAVADGTPENFIWTLDGNDLGTFSIPEVTLTPGQLVALDDGDAILGIEVEVDYGSGSPGVGTDNLMVLNVAPTFDITGEGSVDENAVYMLTLGTPVDPGDDTVTQYIVNWGDGTNDVVNAATDALIRTHIYSNIVGSVNRTISVDLVDEDGTYAAVASKLVRVNGVPPTLLLGGAETAVEGDDYSLTLGTSDLEASTITRWTINWGDGSSETVNAATDSLTHAFADNGDLLVSVTAQDADGIYVATKSVSVANTAPTLTVSGEPTIDEGDGYVLTLAASDPGIDTISSWQINWGDGTTDIVPGSAETASHIYADDSASQPGGVFQIVATATDEDGSYEAPLLDVTVTNVAPVASLGGIGTSAQLLASPPPTAENTVAVNEGSNFILQIGTPRDPGDDIVASYAIDWGDQSDIQTVEAPLATANGFIPTLSVNHAYADGDALYTISVTATEDDGAIGSPATLDVEVRNVAPLLIVTGNGSVNEGDVYTLALETSSDPGIDTVTSWTVNWGDNTTEDVVDAATAALTHVFADDGEYTVTMTAEDEDGSYVATRLVTVVNVAPMISLSGATSVDEGSPYTLTLGAVTDPGADTVTNYIVNWGDGTSDTYGSGGEVTHVYADGVSTPTIRVNLEDEDGTHVGADSLRLRVNNVVPTIALSGAASVDEGSPYTLTLDGVTDPGADAVTSYIVNWGDGTSDTYGSAGAVTHTYADGPSTPAIRVDLVDEDGPHLGAGMLSVAVSNVAPTLGNLVTTPIDENSTTTLTGTITDPGTLDTFTLNVNWGDPLSPGNTEIIDLSASLPTHVIFDTVSQIFSVTHQYLDDNPGATPSDAYTIDLTVTDDDTGVETASTQVTVANVAPTLTLDTVDAVLENGIATLTGMISDPGTLDTFTLDIDWGDPLSPNNTEMVTFGASATGSQSFTLTHKYLDDNPSGTLSDVYTISATVTDDDDGFATVATTVTVNNVTPTLTLNAVSAILENGIATLTGMISDPGTLDTFTLDIDWGDPLSSGNIENIDLSAPLPAHITFDAALRTFSVTHRYLDDDPTDIYTITARVTDDDTGSALANTSVTVSNVAPTLELNAFNAILENGIATLTGTITDPGTLDTFTLDIDWGDALSPNNIEQYNFSPSATGSQPFTLTHQYLDDNGTGTPSDIYTISATVTDDDTGVGGASTEVTVANVASTLSLDAVNAIVENGIATLTGTITDPGTLDTFTLNIDWGDVLSPNNTETVTFAASSTGSQSFTLTHQYLDDNPTGTSSDIYTIGLTVTDDDTGVGSASTEVTVANVAPTLTLDTVDAVLENGIATLTGTITDPGTLDTFTLDIDWGDLLSPNNTETVTFAASSTGSQSFTLTHQYLDDNPSATASDVYTIGLTMTDDDTGVGLGSATVTVNNVDPVITTFDISDLVIDENGAIDLTGAFTDIGSLDAHMVEIDWGDGDISAATVNAVERTFTASHTYLDDDPSVTPSDDYNITVTVTDDDTGEGMSSAVVTVNNVAPEINTLVSDAEIPGDILPGEPATVSGSFLDAGSVDVHDVIVDWGDGISEETLAIGARAFSISHDYAIPDIYQISVSIRDDDGATSPVSTTDAFLAGAALRDGELIVLTTPGNDLVSITESAGIFTVVTAFPQRSVTKTFDVAEVESISVQMFGGQDILQLIGAELDDRFVVTPDTVFWNELPAAHLGAEIVEIYGGAGADEFFVTQTDSNIGTRLFGGLGDDGFDVDSGASFAAAASLPGLGGTLSGIGGLVTIDGGEGGSDTLNVDNTADTGPDTVGTLTATTITGLGMSGEIQYANIEALEISLGSGGNVFDIAGTMRREGENTQIVVNTGSGNDLVTVLLDGASDGPLQVNLQAGNDILNASDSSLGMVVFGGDGTDIIAGGSGADTIHGEDGQDVLIGGAGGDRIDGGADEDLIFGDNVRLERTAASASLTNPRYRQLLDGELYGTGLDSGKNALVSGVEEGVPEGAAIWEDFEITLLDHGDADEAAGPSNFGDDYIAGGADDDQIFGQLGNDTIQGDGSIDLAIDAGASRDGATGLLTVVASVESTTDGDDYIEGGGGDDVIFGNLGQDDIIGGSSRLFSLTDPTQRPDGADLIFGGAGTDVDRNDAGDGSHGRDSDMILGDNGNIFRLLDATGAPLSFNYDDGYGEQIVVRASELLDYTLGGPDKVPGAVDIGDGDELHGESGDDFIYGQTGNDTLFGEGQDDDLIGGWGHDWMSGGTGSDGMLGDDGRIFTSRNSAVYGEPLYGVDPLAASDPDSKFNNGDVLNEEIATPGDVQYAIINVAGELKKSVDLTPFNVMENGDFKGNAQYADDSMYGGLGDDWMHGGSGDDAMSGAEALASFYNNPVPLANALAYSATTGEFAAYDEYEPLLRIDGFLLDFRADEGENLEMADGRTYYSDGDDRIFGDLGNDWIVGGTGRDNLYGGWGDDLLDADDDHATNGGLNDAADTHWSYEDRAYGGAGRDRLIANAVEDRLIDWAGQFNSFILPFPSVGHGTVTGSMQPHLAEFLYALSEGDGVDLTLGAPADPRNGEPFGELGVVRRQDADWQDQTGAPADIAHGNIPAGKREVLRATSFEDAIATGFFADSGTWTVQGAVLQVAAESLGGDAVSVYHLGEEQLPGYFELLASVKMDKANAGWNANAYAIFDYQNEQDFKFVGIDDSINKLVMGHRDESGWHVDVQGVVQGGVKPDKWYNMLVAINGVNVTLVVDNKEVFQHTYAPRIEDGYAFGLNAGMVGVGSNNSRGWFDNIRVQVLPPQLNFDNTEDFEDGVADLFTMGTTGVWSVSDGRYRVDPSIDPSGSSTGISLLDLGPDNLNFNSYLELNSMVNAQSRAGFVFDRYGEDSFKFVAIDAGADQLIIGHYTSKAGWVSDAVVSTVIDAGTDYVLGVALKGTTANATLKAVGDSGYQAIVGHAFNAATVDGNFGLLATGGSANFDDVRVKTDDPAFADNLMASAAPQTLADSEGILTSDTLNPIVDEAIARWTETPGVDDALVAALHDVSFQIVDFDNLTLGRAIGDIILIDADAAGFGWFIDETPADNIEFGLQLSDGEMQAIRTSEAFGRMDLLTVVMHELGHVLGLEDLDPEAHDVMSETLDAGERHVPAAAEQEQIQEDLIDLVAMDLEPETGVSEGSFPAAITSAQNGWLLDFLLETAKGTHNPYEPNEDDGIQIVLFDNKKDA